MSFAYIVALTAVVCAAGILHVDGACYQWSVSQDIQSCLSGFNRAFNIKSGTFSADNIKQYCATSSASEVQCVRNIINDCKDLSGKIREILDKTVDMNAISNAIGIICDDNSTAALEEAKDCLMKTEPGVTSCLQEKVPSDMVELKSKTDVDDMFEEMCHLHTDMAQCEAPFGDNCGRDVQTVFDAMLHATKPPVCSAVSTSVTLALVGVALAFLGLTTKF